MSWNAEIYTTLVSENKIISGEVRKDIYWS